MEFPSNSHFPDFTAPNVPTLSKYFFQRYKLILIRYKLILIMCSVYLIFAFIFETQLAFLHVVNFAFLRQYFHPYNQKIAPRSLTVHFYFLQTRVNVYWMTNPNYFAKIQPNRCLEKYYRQDFNSINLINVVFKSSYGFFLFFVWIKNCTVLHKATLLNYCDF